jgi:tRNA A37 N6-isopentenylltransferase MiaA
MIEENVIINAMDHPEGMKETVEIENVHHHPERMTVVQTDMRINSAATRKRVVDVLRKVQREGKNLIVVGSLVSWF